MTSDTRVKMVAGAAELMSRRGVNATSVREVVRHTGTPRGSISHHFPNGKQQLIEDAIVFAGAQVSGPLRHLTSERGAMAGLHAFITLWKKTLERTNYQAGCPILAVAVEEYIGDVSDKNTAGGQATQRRLLDLAQSVFADWQQILFAALKREGLPASRARRLATLIIASVEGTVAMCRAARSAQPLEEVSHELEVLLMGAIKKH
ncbi:TetR/AcrR family transcriptional regulator [Bradyrhizobium sp. CCGUVB14]|uniref:TetR/AcrR family transcriptional regulator n=1 Tax=Bradyrhizobium sp. CCGUVB14 TaxID=2949628 RepID=UPI0020B1DE67|nr:TetR/AcrR family transcriptional regulator [Bradyrhizobium sp. CCGUVB14]MCP3446121.1 TetR/AcrR family transcriptional regulator [Bradyrhizobium sp. CCGUVB14]